MAITITNLGSSAAPDINNNVDATSYATASYTPPTGTVIVYVDSRTADADATSPPVVPTVTGNGLTWIQIATVTYRPASAVNRGRLSLFAANNTPAIGTAGATTFDFGTQTQTRCNLSFFSATGLDLSGGVTGAFVQAPTFITGSVTGLTIALAAASNSNNRPIVGFGHTANEGANPRVNWTELDDLASGSPAQGLETQYRSDAFETTASATWASTADAAAIAAELKCLVSNSYNDAVSITRKETVSDSNSSSMVASATVAKKDTVSDSKSLSMVASATVAKRDAVSDSNNASMRPALTLAKVDSISDSNIASLLASLNIGKIDSILFTSSLLVLVTKGYVTVIDFSTNPVTVTSYAAIASAADVANSASASSNATNPLTATDTSANVEASDS